jgi:hypothetical protein
VKVTSVFWKLLLENFEAVDIRGGSFGLLTSFSLEHSGIILVHDSNDDIGMHSRTLRIMASTTQISNQSGERRSICQQEHEVILMR